MDLLISREAQIAAFEAELQSRPVPRGEFRCPECRFLWKNDDRHELFALCYSCGGEELERLLVEGRGEDTKANRQAVLTALVQVVEQLKANRRARRRKLKVV